ncbi:hypothetical protein DKK76_04745, partial [Frischella perrara]
TECHADDANFHPSVVNNERDKANNYRCRSYVYTPDGHGFSPLAQINGRGRGGEIYYYCNDHLGTPQELVTAQGEIVWSAVYKSYGNLAIDYQTVPQPLRLPGQYFDEESGLHYNRHRYYDPHCARYISQDPVGLAGGLNFYQYVINPLTCIDPLGLTSCQLAAAMEKATGISRPANSAAHHIVPETTKGAQKARDILKKYGIDVNGAENGVFLPNYKNTNGMPGILHNGKHPNSYIDAINDRIERAAETGGRDGVLEELDNIRNILASADRNASWYTILS